MAIINEWLSIDKTSGTGNAQITLTASSYEELVERTQSLVIQGQRESVYLNVKQNGIVPSITLDTRTLNFEYIGGTQTVTVNSNVPWSAIVGEGDWFTVNKTSGEKGVTTISVTADRNSLYENKNGIIEFAYEGSVLATLNINLEQKPTPTASLEKTNMDFSYTADNDTNTITTNSYWKAVCDGEWFSINPISGDGTTQFTILVTVNDSYDAREGKIYFYSDDDILMATLTVSQEGKVRPTATLDYYTINAYGFGGDYKNGITSSVPWTAVVNGDWITIDEMSGTDGYTSLNINIDETSVNRNGSIAFTYDGLVLCELQIEQLNTIPAENQLTYRTSNKRIFQPYNYDKGAVDFGTMNVISNTYDVANDLGTIICSHPIKVIDWVDKDAPYNYGYPNQKLLTEMFLPEGLEKIEERTFRTASIQSIIFPTTLKTIETSAFESSSLATINFPSSLTYVGAFCFARCNNLTEVFIPYTLSKGFNHEGVLYEGLNKMGANMFYVCSNLRSITFEEGTTYIPSSICAYCRSLTTVTFPTTLLSIGKHSFYDAKLSELVLPNNLIMIHRSAFGGSNATYENLTIPNSVRYIMEGAFEGNTQLKRLVMNPEIVGERAFFNCNSIEYCDWGNRLQKVGKEGLYFVNDSVDCEYAKTIPSTITFIDDVAFDDTFKVTPENIANLTNLEYIGRNAFNIFITNNPIINMPNSLVFCEGININRNSNFNEDIIVNFGNNLRYCGRGIDYDSYVRFATATPPYITNLVYSQILNNDGEYAVIKGLTSNGFTFNVEYTTTDGELWDNPFLSDFITNHVYGTVSYFIPPQKIAPAFIGHLDIRDTDNLKTITFPENFDYVYSALSVDNASNLELIKSPSSYFANNAYSVVDVELYDKVVKINGWYYANVINPDNLLCVNNAFLPYQPLNAYVITGSDIIKGWKNYKSTYGSFTVDLEYSTTDVTFILNDKMATMSFLERPEDDPNITFVYKDADIEEFYTL